MILKPISLQKQVKEKITIAANNPQEAWFSVFDGQDLEKALAEHQVTFRDRSFPPDLTLMTFVMQKLSAESSCRSAVFRISSDMPLVGKKACSLNTSSYVRARQRLPVDLIRSLSLDLAKKVTANTPEDWRWQGFHVKMIDGTTILMPDTVKNQQAFPQHGQQNEGAGFPICRLVAMICGVTGVVLDLNYAAFQGKGTGEMSLCRPLLKHLVRGDLIIVDRLYCSYFFIADILARGAEFVSRSHAARDTDFRSGTRLGEGDHTVTLKKPQRPVWMSSEDYEKIPDTIIVREFKASIVVDGFRPEEIVIVTTLMDHKRFSKTKVKELYDGRWHVELDLRNIKSTMKMEKLTCNSPEMIEKEIWAGILGYNIVRSLMVIAANRSKLLPRELSFKSVLQGLAVYSPKWGCLDPAMNEILFDLFMEQIASQRVGNRPGRSEPRLVKRRPKPFGRLQEPRAAFKARLHAA